MGIYWDYMPTLLLGLPKVQSWSASPSWPGYGGVAYRSCEESTFSIQSGLRCDLSF